MKKHLPILIFALFITAFSLVAFLSRSVFAGISAEQPASTGAYKTYEFFVASTTPFAKSATTTTATSTNIVAFTDTLGRIDKGYFVIAGAKEVSMYFGRTGLTANAGSSRFRVQVTDKTSPAETDWLDWNVLTQNLATSTDPTTVSSVTIATATSTVISGIDNRNNAFYAVRCIVLETTDGEHSCSASASF